MHNLSKTFHRLKNKKIVIYGTGYIAKALIESLNDFDVIGILSNNDIDIGRKIYSKKILSLDQIIKIKPNIILAAQKGTPISIFKDLNQIICKLDFSVYSIKAHKITLKDLKNNKNKTLYTVKKFKLLKKQINNNSLISFDIFDTLVSRKVLHPFDVFLLVENEINKKYKQNYKFSTIRLESEIECQYANPNLFSLDDIYLKIKKKLKISKKILLKIKSMEIKFEKKLLTPRKDVIKLFRYAINKKKTVLLLSDMHLRSRILRKILTTFNVTHYNNIFVSCDLKKSKINGNMYREIIKNYNNVSKHLHIGDDIVSDIHKAKSFKIKTAYLPSPRKLLSTSSINGINKFSFNSTNKLALGLIANKIFNNPFVKLRKNNKPIIEDFDIFGYFFYGPLVFYYLIWLINHSNKLKINKIFFCAREGYFLLKLFNLIKLRLSLKNIAEGIYFITSRRMATVPAIFNNDDILHSFYVHRFYGIFSDLLSERFGISIKRGDKNSNKFIDTRNNLDDVNKFISEYKADIISNARIERENYLNYLNKICPSKREKIAMVDQGFNATVQFNIQKIMKRKFIGLYLCAKKENNPYNIKTIEGFYNYGTSFFCKKTYFFESVFTSPEGSHIRFDSYKKLLFDKKKNNQKKFHYKKNIFNGILEFANDMLDIMPRIEDIETDSEMPDNIFGLLGTSDLIISNNIKKTFFLDNQFVRSNDKILNFDIS